jgi:hypothetical protein
MKDHTALDDLRQRVQSAVYLVIVGVVTGVLCGTVGAPAFDSAEAVATAVTHTTSPADPPEMLYAYLSA